jgi:NSS family neurotransmitter:Na+ symporter
MAGSNGGSAFVLVYLGCVILVGLPVMVAEILIGRRARKNSVCSLKDCAVESKRTPAWQALGWWGLGGLLLTLSFYSVVAGWSLYYLFLTLSGGFVGLDSHAITHIWAHFMSSPGQLMVYHGLFMFLTMWVVGRGVEKGLERASWIMMPLLFIVLFVLVGYAAVSTGPAFGQAVHFLFDPNFHKITGPVVINALGHAFFTLAIGVGAMSIYGSYLPKGISIGKSVVVAAGLDVLAAILSGLAIFPIIFAYHLNPQAGPGLMFLTLPIAFAKMVGGEWIGGLFFALLLFAAWTSSINIAEPLVGALTEKTKLSRKQAAALIGVLAWLVGLLSVFSFNIWVHVKVLGIWSPFELITDLVTNVILPIGGVFYALFAGWAMLPKHTQEELAFTRPAMYSIWRFLIRYIAPLGVLLIFVFALV